MILFYNLSIETCFSKLKSSSSGLSQQEAQIRLQQNGKNSLPGTKSSTAFSILFSQFQNPLILLLLVAGIISLVIGKHLDAEIVFGAILVNVIIGFFQENKANNALNQLKEMIKSRVIVRRDGQELELDSSELVVGDLVLLSAGEQITIDGRIIKSIDLQVNEANLTGESNSVYKTTKILPTTTGLADRRNMVYSGTVVSGGHAEVLVTAQGSQTELGKISHLVLKTKDRQTPLQHRLKQLSRLISLVAIVISVLIVVLGLIQGRDFFNIFLTAVAVAVAAVPEGLVVAVTVILTLGMKQILRQKALTRKLLAVETLGSITTICTDKTGTLTTGQMQVASLIIDQQELNLQELLNSSNQNKITPFLKLIKAGLLCNNAILEKANDSHPEKTIGSPVESALLDLGLKAGIDRQQLLAQEVKISELSFNSKRKFMISIHRSLDNDYTLYEKGAPEKIIAKATEFLTAHGPQKLTEDDKEKLLKKVADLSSQGLRLIAIASKKLTQFSESQNEKRDWEKLDRNLVLLGLVTLQDPLRPDARQTISLCRRAGIRPIIITGDHPQTAWAIARQLDFKSQLTAVIDGQRLMKTSAEELKIIVQKHDIYARVSPEDKLRIVQALQANGEVVAMTGDGLNDSPALKTADIGVCLGSGTDVARATADLVLLDNNFKVIVKAIHEGRIIFNNIRKSITYLISDSFSEMFLIIGSIFFNLPLAILPAQILWVNIINDGLPNFSLAFERSDQGIMDQPPLPKTEPIINREMKIIIFYLGLIRDFGILLLFIYLYKHQALWGWDLNYLRTLFFALLGFKSISGIFSLRSLKIPIHKIKHWQNPYLFGAFLISLLLLILAIYWGPLQKIVGTVALSLNGWLLIFAISLINIISIEVIKYSFRKKSLLTKKL